MNPVMRFPLWPSTGPTRFQMVALVRANRHAVLTVWEHLGEAAQPTCVWASTPLDAAAVAEVWEFPLGPIVDQSADELWAARQRARFITAEHLAAGEVLVDGEAVV